MPSSDDQIRVDTPEQIALEFPLAGIGSRFMAVALDTLIQFFIYIAGIFALVETEKYATYFPGLFSHISSNWAAGLMILFLFGIYWGYFAFFEILWKGQTPGKRVAGIRVIYQTGRPINVYEAIGRNLMRAVDLLPTMYLVGIITMMISRENRRLGDYLVGSIVVHDKRADDALPEWSPSAIQESLSPELAKLTADELVLIETYLQRRDRLDFGVRDATAHQIATRISAKTGLQRDPAESLDHFLEKVATQVRNSARFR